MPETTLKHPNRIKEYIADEIVRTQNVNIDFDTLLERYIEEEVKRAREEMKKDILKAIDDRIIEMDKDFVGNQPFIAEAHGIQSLITSLK